MHTKGKAMLKCAIKNTRFSISMLLALLLMQGCNDGKPGTTDNGKPEGTREIPQTTTSEDQKPGDLKGIFVNAATSGDGTSFSKGFRTIQEAVKAAKSGDIIYIAAGVYKAHDSKNIVKIEEKNNIQLVGGYSAQDNNKSDRNLAKNQVVLDGERNNRAIL